MDHHTSFFLPVVPPHRGRSSKTSESPNTTSSSVQSRLKKHTSFTRSKASMIMSSPSSASAPSSPRHKSRQDRCVGTSRASYVSDTQGTEPQGWTRTTTSSSTLSPAGTPQPRALPANRVVVHQGQLDQQQHRSSNNNNNNNNNSFSNAVKDAILFTLYCLRHGPGLLFVVVCFTLCLPFTRRIPAGLRASWLALQADYEGCKDRKRAEERREKELEEEDARVERERES